ncbi:MAG: DUF3667 domain-containing protein [Tannerella sp.]|jgi:hypothetical protein|nr:DUF3667 domain-containing protein [Tannerella sp.]
MKKTVPVHAVCRNCGTQLVSRYCHNCGQDLFAGARRTVKDLFLEAFVNIFCLDNKILVTLKYLLFYPGKLSTEYARGRIASYVHPSKLFWFAAVLMVAMLSSTIKWENKNDAADKEKITVGYDKDAAVKKEKRDAAKVQADEPASGVATGDDDKHVLEEIWNMNDVKSYFSTYAPIVVMLIVPVFAFNLYILFRRQRRLYVDHLVFAMHVHSFIFLFYALLIAARKIPGVPHFSSPVWLILVIPLLYLAIAAYRFYRLKIWTFTWRMLLLIISYSVGLFLSIILFALVFAFLLENVLE